MLERFLSPRGIPVDLIQVMSLHDNTHTSFIGLIGLAVYVHVFYGKCYVMLRTCTAIDLVFLKDIPTRCMRHTGKVHNSVRTIHAHQYHMYLTVLV